MVASIEAQLELVIENQQVITGIKLLDTYFISHNTIIVRSTTEGLDVCASIDVDTHPFFVGEEEFGPSTGAPGIFIKGHTMRTTSGVNLNVGV